MKTRVLIVEDDTHIALGLEEVLKAEGFEASVCSSGAQAVSEALRRLPDLVVLDVMLPGLSGFDVCRQLRSKKFAAPILMLTAKGQELDKVVGLELGADDYMTKPFGVRELVARIHALLRRGPPRPDPDRGAETFHIGAACIDALRFELRQGSVVHELTAREVRLLQLFHAHPGEVLSRDRMLNEVWGHGYFGTTRTLDQVIVQLRRKLGDRADEPRHLLTVHGVGYKLAI